MSNSHSASPSRDTRSSFISADVHAELNADAEIQIYIEIQLSASKARYNLRFDRA